MELEIRTLVIRRGSGGFRYSPSLRLRRRQSPTSGEPTRTVRARQRTSASAPRTQPCERRCRAGRAGSRPSGRGSRRGRDRRRGFSARRSATSGAAPTGRRWSRYQRLEGAAAGPGQRPGAMVDHGALLRLIGGCWQCEGRRGDGGRHRPPSDGRDRVLGPRHGACCCASTSLSLACAAVCDTSKLNATLTVPLAGVASGTGDSPAGSAG